MTRDQGHDCVNDREWKKEIENRRKVKSRRKMQRAGESRTVG